MRDRQNKEHPQGCFLLQKIKSPVRRTPDLIRGKNDRLPVVASA
jgi:hypothetical protein